MDKLVERRFLDFLSRALVSLPFDLKILLEAAADPDLERGVRELAAATAVHVINPKDGNVDATLRHSEDVVLVRLALDRIASQGGEGAAAFRQRFADAYAGLADDLALVREALGKGLVDWMDGRWTTLGKAVFARKRISQLVDDEEVGTFLYDEGLRFATDYPITEKSLAGRVKQAQPFLDHLLRKQEQDRKKIPS